MRIVYSDNDLQMPAGLMMHAQETWEKNSRHVTVSALQKDVSRVLNILGVPHSLVLHIENFSLDIALAGEHSLSLQLNACHNCVVWCFSILNAGQNAISDLQLGHNKSQSRFLVKSPER